MAGAAERLAHVEELLPGDLHARLRDDELRRGRRLRDGQHARDAARDGARASASSACEPELEVFDTGHLVFVHELIREGLIDDPPLIQLCMGIPYGAPDDPGDAARDGATGCPRTRSSRRSRSGGCSCRSSRSRAIVGGNVRVGLEDNLYLSRGRLATNAELVERAVTILEAMNVRVLGPDEVRERLALRRCVAEAARRSACSAAA